MSGALPKIGDTGKLIEVVPRTGNLFVVPAWGYLEALEIRFTPPVPNMDMNAPLRLIIEPLDTMKPFQVFARVRNVVDE